METRRNRRVNRSRIFGSPPSPSGRNGDPAESPGERIQDPSPDADPAAAMETRRNRRVNEAYRTVQRKARLPQWRPGGIAG